MQKYLPVLRSCPFFTGLTDDEILSILHCVSAAKITRPRGSYIFRAGDSTEVMGLMRSAPAGHRRGRWCHKIPKDHPVSFFLIVTWNRAVEKCQNGTSRKALPSGRFRGRVRQGTTHIGCPRRAATSPPGAFLVFGICSAEKKCGILKPTTRNLLNWKIRI